MGAILLRVANTTSTHSLSTAIYKYSEEGDEVELSCLGVLSVYVAVKSIILANRKAVGNGFVFYFIPMYSTKPALRPETEGEERTTVLFRLKKFEIGGRLWAPDGLPSRRVSGANAPP